jgi:hypothetical protein
LFIVKALIKNKENQEGRNFIKKQSGETDRDITLFLFLRSVSDFSAEREGFEPPGLLHPVVFKTTAIDHSAISPLQK